MISMPTRLDYDWQKNLTQTQTQTETQTQSQTLHFEKNFGSLLTSNADTVKTVSPVFRSRIIIKQQRNWEKE
jgi:hypothetical protein